MLQKMKDGDDVREHMRRFFDAVDKLHEMEIEINDDLLTIMLLYSLPTSYENFRCAIESRDELPTPEMLRVKIAEESDARKGTDDTGTMQNAMAAAKWPSRKGHKKRNPNQKSGKNESGRDESKKKRTNRSDSSVTSVAKSDTKLPIARISVKSRTRRKM